MRFRTTPEVAGGASLRSDPQAWAWRVQAGASLPFGLRHSVAAYAWHDGSFDWNANQVVGQNVLAKRGAVTGLGAQTVLARRSGASLMASADARYDDGGGHRRVRRRAADRPRGGFQFGAQAEGAADLWSFMHLTCTRTPTSSGTRRRSPCTKAGRRSGGTGHLFLFPESRVVLFDTGAQVRRLKIAAQGTPEKPTGEPVPGVDRDRLQPLDHADAGGSRRGAR